MDKQAALEEIAYQVRNLTESPLYDDRQEHAYRPVIGQGDLDAEIMLVGEAPGAQEAQTGQPFVGNAGRVLDRMLASVGFEREAVYVTNVVKDRPPGNRDPTAEEIRIYAPFLREQLEIVQPGVIAPLGRFAMDFFLREFDLPQQGQKIGDLHGQVLEAEADHGQVHVVPLYHPAATFYNRQLKDVLEEDFRVLARLVEEDRDTEGENR